MMPGWLRSPLPVLRKELVELSARRRTYIVRVLGAGLMFLFFCLIVYEHFDDARGNQLRILGEGGDMFDVLVTLQFIAVFLFVPAMVSSVITAEKESHSLPLLLITDLRPWEILIEKYGSRMMAAVTFLLLGLPPLAVCYAFGGVSGDYLAGAVFTLLVSCLMAGSIGLLCSTYCRTTAQAFIWAYIIELVVLFGLPVALAVLGGLDLVRYIDEDFAFFLFPPYAFFEGQSGGLGEVILRSTPAAALTGLFVLLARVQLVRRAFAPPRHVALRALKRIDGFWTRVNDKVAGGTVLVHDEQKLPGERPVAWREVHKRAMGRVSHLVRLLLLTEVPVAFLAFFLAVSNTSRYQNEGLTFMQFIVWSIAGLAVSVRAAGLFSAERSGQTLEVLLTTPTSGREIVRQKMAGLWRLMLVVALPLLTVSLFEAWGEGGGWVPRRGQREYDLAYLVSSILCVVVYLPFVAWLSLWVSLLYRARRRAIPGAVLVLLGLCFVPIFVVGFTGEVFDLFDLDDAPWNYLLLLSPASVPAMAEVDELDFLDSIPFGLFLNFAWYGGWTLVLRHWCIRYADARLGRLRDEGGEVDYVARAARWLFDRWGYFLLAGAAGLLCLAGVMAENRELTVMSMIFAVLAVTAQGTGFGARPESGSSRVGLTLRSLVWAAAFLPAALSLLVSHKVLVPRGVLHVSTAVDMPDGVFFACFYAVFFLVWCPVIAWGGAWVVLKVRDRPLGVILTLSAALAWSIILPPLAYGVCQQVADLHFLEVMNACELVGPLGVAKVLLHASPPSLLSFKFSPSWAVAALAVNAVLHLGLLMILQSLCLRHVRRQALSAEGEPALALEPGRGEAQ